MSFTITEIYCCSSKVHGTRTCAVEKNVSAGGGITQCERSAVAGSISGDQEACDPLSKSPKSCDAILCLELRQLRPFSSVPSLVCCAEIGTGVRSGPNVSFDGECVVPLPFIALRFSIYSMEPSLLRSAHKIVGHKPVSATRFQSRSDFGCLVRMTALLDTSRHFVPRDNCPKAS